MSAKNGQQHDPALKCVWLPPQMVVRVVGAVGALTAVFVLVLGALDDPSPGSPGTGGPGQSVSRWLPSALFAVSRTQMTLVSPAEAAPHPALGPVIEESETPEELASIPAAAPLAIMPAAVEAAAPDSATVETAALAPEQDRHLSSPSDLQGAFEKTAVTASIPLPTPAPERPPLPPTPAERLGLTAEERTKAEKCIAQAVYFEARGERLIGQAAVAQVVMNRVFSPFYPNDVCGVVYQNAHQRLACQFTFACDGRPERITESRSWRRAKWIARKTLDGKVWVAEVAKSTHYHAARVRPRWIRTMKTLGRHGDHTFYRPRRWGDGSKETDWSNIVHLAGRAVIVE